MPDGKGMRMNFREKLASLVGDSADPGDVGVLLDSARNEDNDRCDKREWDDRSSGDHHRWECGVFPSFSGIREREYYFDPGKLLNSELAVIDRFCRRGFLFNVVPLPGADFRVCIEASALACKREIYCRQIASSVRARALGH